jgi:hypothetical protein
MRQLGNTSEATKSPINVSDIKTKSKDKEVVVNPGQQDERVSGLDFGSDSEESDDFQIEVAKIQSLYQSGGSTSNNQM